MPLDPLIQAGIAEPAPPWALRHEETFSGKYQTHAQTYLFSFDEARKNSLATTRAMRRDARLMRWVKARQRPVAKSRWSIVPEDSTSPQQKRIAEELTKIVLATPDLMKLRFAMQEAVWFGRYGVQVVHGWAPVAGQQRLVVKQWRPVNGDKITFKWDGTPVVRVWPAARAKLQEMGATIETSEVGTVLVLDKPAWRERFIIHKHEIEDADYDEPELAGGVHGVGLRHGLYWIDHLGQIALSWMTDYLERFGAGGLTIYFYEHGNQESYDKALAASRARGNGILLPAPIGGEKPGNMVQRIEPSGTGNDILFRLIDFYDQAKREYILGQNLSSESAPTGMNSGVAGFQANTLADILEADATNHDESSSQDLVMVLGRKNYPKLDFRLRFQSSLQKPAPEKLLDAANKAWSMGAAIKEEEVLEVAGFSKPGPNDKTLQNPQLAHQAGLAAKHAATANATINPQAQQAVSQALSGGEAGLREVRQALGQAGIPPEKQLFQLADLVEAGIVAEADGPEGAVYSLAQAGPSAAGEPVDAQPAEEGEGDLPDVLQFAAEDWVQESGPRGGRRWRHVKTGRIEYGSENPGGDRSASPTSDEWPAPDGQAQPEPKGKTRKGQDVGPVRQRIKDILEGKKHLGDDDIETELYAMDRRLLKGQAVDLAMELGFDLPPKASKARVLGMLEEKFRGVAGKTQAGGQQALAGYQAAGKGEARYTPTEQLSVDPERFQYKLGKSKTTGAGDEFKDVKFDPMFGGIIHTWQDPADGKTYVVNGHHRYDLAKRSGTDRLLTMPIEAGSAEEARALGALVNMAGGHGTATDAAKFMRDMNVTAEDLKGRNISLKGRIASDATALAGLEGSLFNKLTMGTLSEPKALAIAQNAKDPAAQLGAMKLADQWEKKHKRPPGQEIMGELARQAQHAPVVDKTTDEGMFGSSTQAVSTVLERAELTAHVRAKLSEAHNAFKAVATDRRAGMLEVAGNQLNVGENRRLAELNETARGSFDKLAYLKGEVSDLLNNAAEELARDPKQSAAIKQRLTDDINAILTNPERMAAAFAGGQSGVPGQGGQADRPGPGAPAGAEPERPGQPDAAGGPSPEPVQWHPSKLGNLDGEQVVTPEGHILNLRHTNGSWSIGDRHGLDPFTAADTLKRLQAQPVPKLFKQGELDAAKAPAAASTTDKDASVAKSRVDARFKAPPAAGLNFSTPKKDGLFGNPEPTASPKAEGMFGHTGTPKDAAPATIKDAQSARKREAQEKGYASHPSHVDLAKLPPGAKVETHHTDAAAGDWGHPASSQLSITLPVPRSQVTREQDDYLRSKGFTTWGGGTENETRYNGYSFGPDEAGYSPPAEPATMPPRRPIKSHHAAEQMGESLKQWLDAGAYQQPPAGESDIDRFMRVRRSYADRRKSLEPLLARLGTLTVAELDKVSQAARGMGTVGKNRQEKLDGLRRHFTDLLDMGEQTNFYLGPQRDVDEALVRESNR